MQSSVLCRQNCRNSHLPFPFLVHSIHLPPCHCRLQHLLRACALTLLVITCCNYLHVYICVCILCLISTSPSLSSILSFCLSCCDFADLLKVTGTLCTCNFSHQHSFRIASKDYVFFIKCLYAYGCAYEVIALYTPPPIA